MCVILVEKLAKRKSILLEYVYESENIFSSLVVVVKALLQG